MKQIQSLVYNEDCYATLQRTEDGKINLLLQDPPFGATKNSWDVKPDLAKMWPEWERVGAENAAFLFFATQPFASELVLSNLKMFRYDLVWYKQLSSGFLNAKKMPLRNHELILVFYRKLPTYNPQMRTGKKQAKGRKHPNGKNSNYGSYKELGLYTNDQYYPESVLDFTNGDRTVESDHPTQKPLSLIRYLTLTYSNPGDWVYDGYVGSGTTREAAYVEGRNFIGAENDTSHGYYEQQEGRFQKMLATPTIF